MPTAAPHSETDPVSVSGRGRLLVDLAAGLLVTLTTAGGSWWLLGLTASQVVISSLAYLLLAAVVFVTLPDGSVAGIGAANRVTLGRAALAVPLAALLLVPDLDASTAWWVIAVSTAVLVLDALDGAVARRLGATTRFGARFDMEVDAALILVLALLVWRADRAGAWVVLIGAMRYLYVAAALLRPELRAELPESRRRKVICVVQSVSLLVALGPIVPDPLALGALAGALAALTYSFGVDALWALRHGVGEPVQPGRA